MADLNKFQVRMAYWCSQAANLGYDQSNRWDIREGGESDCSSLVIHALREAGFDTGGATYTGNMSSNLTARGWRRVANDGYPQAGDILLNDADHVAVYLGGGKLAQASIDENGRITGGQAGDQTGRETNVSNYYNYPWNCYLRYTGATTSTPQVNSDIDTLAREVINGKYGSGEERKAALGDKYKVVQSRVNEILSGAPILQNTANSQNSIHATVNITSNKYKVGDYVVTVDALNVRSGFGTSSPRKEKWQLTPDGQAHSNAQGQLLSGTEITVQEVRQDVYGNTWGRIPSGWICINYKGEEYARMC